MGGGRLKEKGMGGTGLFQVEGQHVKVKVGKVWTLAKEWKKGPGWLKKGVSRVDRQQGQITRYL